MKITPITGNRDFQRVYRHGKNCVSPGLVTYVLKNKNNNLRIGITTSKKVGKAVRRNRSRRVIRAAFSHIGVDTDLNYDIIFVARTKTCFLKSYDVERYMREHLRSLGILKSS